MSTVATGFVVGALTAVRVVDLTVIPRDCRWASVTVGLAWSCATNGRTMPNGLTGYDGRDEPNHDGFGLPLGKPSQSFIFVRGEYNSAEYDMPRKAATKDVEYLRQDGKEIESETISESRLGALEGARLVVVYTCPGSSDRQILSSLIALSVDKESLYTLEIYSSANRYKSDRAVLDQIIRSWKMISGSLQKKQR